MERNERIDFYKGILMLGVVWGHCITNLLAGDQNTIGIHLIVRTYDMPMFMLLSGYFINRSMRKRSWLFLIKDRFVRIMIPSIIWGTFICKGNVVNGAQSLYFLNAIFLSSLILIVVNKIVVSKLNTTIVLVLISILLNFIPLSLFNLSYLFPFFALGYVVSLFQLHRPSRNVMGGAFLLWITALCFWQGQYTIWATGTYFSLDNYGDMLPIFIFRYVIAIVGILSIISICEILFDYFSKIKSYFCSFAITSGRETLMIYILHIIPLILINHAIVLSKNFFGFNPLNFNHLFLGYVLAPLLSVILIYVIIKALSIAKRYKWLRYVCGYKVK